MQRALVGLLGLLSACGGPAAIIGGPFPGDPENFSYDLEGTKVTLQKGTNEVRTGDKPDDLIATDLTGHRLDADLDGDKSTDRAVVLTRDDGTLKLHYLVVLRNPGGDVVATEAVRLGKNVLVEKLELDPKGKGFIVELLGRDEEAPEDLPPSIRLTRRFQVLDGKLTSLDPPKK